jgi:hypothetical protein
MNWKQEIIEELLESSLSIDAIYFTDDGLVEVAERFETWTEQVALAFESADMIEEIEMWNQANENKIFSPGGSFSSDINEANFKSDLSAMRAVLLGILDKLDQAEPAEVARREEKVHEIQRRILEAIASIQQQCNQEFVTQAQIAERLELDLQMVRDRLILMGEQGYVTLTAVGGGYIAGSTARGRVALQEPEYVQQEPSSQDSLARFETPDNFGIGGSTVAKISRTSIIEAVTILEGWTHAEIDRFLLEFELEEVAPQDSGSKRQRANILIRYLSQNPDELGPSGERLSLEIIERLIMSRLHSAYGWEVEPIEEQLPKLVQSLKRDGYAIVDGRLETIPIENTQLADEETVNSTKQQEREKSEQHRSQKKVDILPTEEVSMVSILFLAADPTDATRLRLGEELREIQEKLQLAQLRDRFVLHQRMSVRPADLSQALLDMKPQIVHFSGHGTVDGELCIEDESGNSHPIQSDALGALFEQFANQVNCVVLNACYSETQANAIAEHIDYVIGMSQAIGDKAAIAFAIGFYQALGAGRSIEEAYRLGCVQIRLQGIVEHLTPALIKKS